MTLAGPPATDREGMRMTHTPHPTHHPARDPDDAPPGHMPVDPDRGPVPTPLPEEADPDGTPYAPQ